VIRIIPAEERYYSDKGWVKSFLLFSYSDYYNRKIYVSGSLELLMSLSLIQTKDFHFIRMLKWR